MFAGNKRDFSDSETGIIEMVAGRVAAELEREMLWHEGASAAVAVKEIAAAQRMQRSQLPTISPMLDGWDLAGWTEQAGPLGGDFHDWFSLPDGLLAVAVGHAMEQGVTAALVSSSLKSALRAHGPYFREAQQTLKRLNLTLWTGSAGDQHASLMYALVETATGRVCASSAGRVAAVMMRRNHWERLSFPTSQLGAGPETDYEQFGYEMERGDCLILASEGVFGPNNGGVRGCEVEIAQTLIKKLHLPAADLAAALRKFWCNPARGQAARDRTALVLKRR
jgi:serine phosphatase RsbU (regulator of sigma subunit)